MYEPLDSALIRRYYETLDSKPPAGRQKEQVVQDFLEEHTEFIPTPNLLNHQLSLKSVISKFPLSTSLVTDYVYLTKSSSSWRVTLVELESPDKPIFTKNRSTPTQSAEFTAALAQVAAWKDFVETSGQQVIESLAPVMVPSVMRRNPVSFEYQLIIGRSHNKNESEDRKRRFERLQQESGVTIYTYDAVASFYEQWARYKKNVLRLVRKRFSFKSMLPEPSHVFAYMAPSTLDLSKQQEAILVKNGYDIPSWRLGELLVVNDRLPIRKDEVRRWRPTIRRPPSSK